MDSNKISRRGFIQIAAVAGAAISASGQISSSVTSVRLGAPVFEKADDPEALALAHRKLQYGAAYCPNVKTTDADMIKAYADAFAKHDVIIAEVGRWCNMMEADAEKRKVNIDNVTDGLALAEAIGARCCVDIAGSFNT